MGETRWREDPPDIQPGYRGQPPWQPNQSLVPLPTIAAALALLLVIAGLLLWAVL